MNFLPQSAIDAVRAYDHAHHVAHGMVNRNRFYHYLQPAGQDMEVHTCAVKANRRGVVHVKEVVQASVEDPWLHMTDIALYGIGGYQVDWSPEKVGRARFWSYKGRWETEAWAPRCQWKLCAPVVNPEALQTHPRFRYCAWTEECGHPLDYLKSFKKHPRVELLSKAGIGWLGTRTGFMAQLERSKELQRFVLANLAEIQKCRYGVDVLRMAFRRGVSLTKAGKLVALRREWGREHLPRTIDAERAEAYTRRLKIGAYIYTRYLRDCATLGLDLRDTKTAFPRQFGVRRQIVADQVAEIQRRRQAELAKKQDADIAATAKRFARLERARAAFCVVIPRRTADLIREGKRLANCLGDGHYAAKMARGECLLAFVRRSRQPKAAFVAVEFDLRQGKVLQCYAAKNQRPPAPVLKFVERVFKKARAA